MKETHNSPSICKYEGATLDSKHITNIIETMMEVVKEDLYKYKITIDFKE